MQLNPLRSFGWVMGLSLRATLTVCAILVCTTISGCTAFNYTSENAPQQLNTALLKSSPRIAVVLGSGGPRGYAHIGVIRALEDAGIVPDLIVGSSVGAFIGSFWASGRSAQDIEQQSENSGPLTIFDINPFADRGWIRGQRLQDYVNTQLNNKPIEALKTKLIVVATRRQDKQAVPFAFGDVGVAVRASSSVPGIFSPVGINGTEFEDSDSSLPLAVSVALAAGAQFVIAVDVSALANSAPVGTNKEWLARDSLRRARIDPEAKKADFLIHPDLGYLASPRRAYAVMAQEQGLKTTQQQIPALITALRNKFADWKPTYKD